MPEDCPTTVKKEKHGNRKSGHEYREEAVLKGTKAVVKAKATAKAKAVPTKSILKNWSACPKKTMRSKKVWNVFSEFVWNVRNLFVPCSQLCRMARP